MWSKAGGAKGAQVAKTGATELLLVPVRIAIEMGSEGEGDREGEGSDRCSRV